VVRRYGLRRNRSADLGAPASMGPRGPRVLDARLRWSGARTGRARAPRDAIDRPGELRALADRGRRRLRPLRFDHSCWDRVAGRRPTATSRRPSPRSWPTGAGPDVGGGHRRRTCLRRWGGWGYAHRCPCRAHGRAGSGLPCARCSSTTRPGCRRSRRDTVSPDPADPALPVRCAGTATPATCLPVDGRRARDLIDFGSGDLDVLEATGREIVAIARHTSSPS
jgi:hypothetical protein